MKMHWTVVLVVTAVLVAAGQQSALSAALRAVTDALGSVSLRWTPMVLATAVSFAMVAVITTVNLAHRPRRRVHVLARRGRSVGEIARRTHLPRDAVRTLLELRGKPCSPSRKDLPLDTRGAASPLSGRDVQETVVQQLTVFSRNTDSTGMCLASTPPAQGSIHMTEDV